MSTPVSSGSPSGTGELPVVSQTLEPAWVRNGSASTQKAYETALEFEQMLVEQLSQSLTASSGLGGEEGEEGESSSEAGSSASSAASGPISSMLPQALTSGVMSAGGLGLAAQMTRELQGAAAATPTVANSSTSVAATGGTSVATPATGSASASDGVGATGGTSA